MALLFPNFVISTDTSEDCLLSWGALLKNCRDLSQGTQIHARIAQSEHRRNKYLANLLVQMYGKCGSVDDARAIFESIENPKLFSSNITIRAYAQAKDLNRARRTFDGMLRRDASTWNSIVTAYADNGHLDKAREVFELAPEKNEISWNVMITLCIRSGKIASVKDLFDRMPVKTIVAQTVLVTAFARKGHLNEAEALFENIKEERDVESWAFGSRCLQTTPTEQQMQATAFEVKRLLIAGKQKEALRAAQDGQLWGCALLMARQLGEKVPCLVALMYRLLVMVLWFLIVLH
ncbi:pentatricopeptide repeat-containing protein At4g02750-like [Selaginella moellendorffii]|uniref:pentatricopeptide repeat-containing protein At4g02750-like n=1 Tax=Selaginella moellendorffii TaxID=88036 RepID=UPI000D1CDFC2|nr:pentatricopeptide repeat-containing protein At4g02750-like [Selaginella moellendorffii]|eukprot:XP_024522530.1 pentatricopeptide repeat-containing protein At4g02750-like [Selaginella moellendorffii]